jgi:hypothetical protein
MKVIVNAKPHILAPSDEDEDDFTLAYSRLVKVFRGNFSLDVVIPLSLRLYRKVPPDKLDAYISLSQWSCYKTCATRSNWIEQGNELLREATEEQYKIRHSETTTEITRREKTVLRQDLADTAMKQLSHKEGTAKDSDELSKEMDTAKKAAIKDELERWKNSERERPLYSYYKAFSDICLDYGVESPGVVIGGAALVAAVAVGVVAVMKGYHYM